MNADLVLLLGTAASIGCVHALLGPDHYVPFVALARSRRWSLLRTLGVTALCGAGHVAGSLALGALGVAAGWALGSMTALEAVRGAVAGWLLVGFGLAYTAWGVRAALRRRQHVHAHAHADGVVHRHPHGHESQHAHPHFGAAGAARHWLGPWTLFVIFALGPCEPLIPLLMVPAAGGAWGAVAAVALVFALATLATMTAVVAAVTLGVARLPAAPLERWSHALAGAAILACGIGIRFFGL